jgi:C-3',4' desaturase CrtD
MQVLSDRLVTALERDGGELHLRHSVERILTQSGRATGIIVRNQKTGERWTEQADHIIANVTTHDLVRLLGDAAPQGYRRRVDKLPDPSGAFVLYLGVDQSAIPADCPPHLQFLYDYEGTIGENNSLFVSVSHPGDGRAADGKATIIASSFTNLAAWWEGEEGAGSRGQGVDVGSKSNIQHLKQQYTQAAIARLSQFFNLTKETILHVDAATPRTFQRFTGRDRGMVGGIGQRVSTFGPFGFANRTPIPHLWLVGDCTHPGEGTAGVSYSALTVVRQLESY